MLRRQVPAGVAASTMCVQHACASTTTTATAATTHSPKPLLPYAIRRAAAYEMLYGGVRVQHLVQRPFALHKIQSELLPSPSLEAERRDLALEMQLPRDLHTYNSINMNIQRQVGQDVDTPDAAAYGEDGFDMGTYFSEHHHPERHHNSSLPYSQHDTNNVLAMRLFPVNIGLRARTEAVRIRTEDCLQRLRDAKLCAAVQAPLEHPLPLSQRYHYKAMITAGQADGSREGSFFHPSPSKLSIFTRPVDRTAPNAQINTTAAASSSAQRFPVHPFAAVAATRNGVRHAAQSSSRAWMPLQMLKPMGHSWSAATRSSGVRGPHMQLMQERLDQKGFGWKRKSRSLWQQDIATAGFRPHRYF